MRLSIRHETRHHFAQPAKSVIQSLRLTPRNHEGQHVVHWHIDIDVECRLKASQDAFGNIVHGFTSNGPHAVVAVTAVGEVDTFDTRGVVSGAVERFPPELYLRPTPLAKASAAQRAEAEASMAGEERALDRLHALLRALSPADPASARQAQAGALYAQAAEAGEASAEDLAHLFIALARFAEIPARYVAGYRLDETDALPNAMHGWAEAFVPGLGWVGIRSGNRRLSRRALCARRHRPRCARRRARRVPPTRGARSRQPRSGFRSRRCVRAARAE